VLDATVLPLLLVYNNLRSIAIICDFYLGIEIYLEICLETFNEHPTILARYSRNVIHGIAIIPSRLPQVTRKQYTHACIRTTRTVVRQTERERMIGRVARLYFSLPRTRRAFGTPSACITSAVRARAPFARRMHASNATRDTRDINTIMTFLPKVILVVLYDTSKLRREGRKRELTLR